jgi:hypothetical protein
MCVSQLFEFEITQSAAHHFSAAHGTVLKLYTYHISLAYFLVLDHIKL